MLTQADILQRIADNRRVRWISALHLGLLVFEILAVRLSTLAETGRLWTSRAEMLQTSVPVTVILVVSVSLALTFTRHQAAARGIQVLSLLLGGSAAIALNPTSTPASGVFFSIAWFLANRYGYLDRRARLKTAGLLALFLASAFIATRLYGRRISFILIAAIIFVLAYSAVWFIAAEMEVRGLVTRYSTARMALVRDRINVEFGRRALAFMHVMSGRMVALDRAVEILRNGGDGKDAGERIEAVRADMERMLSSLKLGVVHQTESEPRDIKVGDVLKGLVALAELTLDGKARSHPVTVEVLEDVGLRAPPAEVYLVFETVLRNAMEAGSHRIAITVGPGRKAVVANDGPPIPFCVGCERRQCMECTEFREGRTTKPSGSGIGMVVVRDIMSRYGSLSISSTAERTEVQFRFR